MDENKYEVSDEEMASLAQTIREILYNDEPEIEQPVINTDFGDGFDAEAFMKMPLPDRFHAYMVSEMCSEENYQEAMRNNGYNYLPMLYRIKKEIPGEFYAYFHDLLHEQEYEYYHKKYLESLNGMV